MSGKRTHQPVGPTLGIDANAPGLGMLDVARTLTRGDLAAEQGSRPVRMRYALLLAFSLGVVLVSAIGMNPTPGEPGDRHRVDRLTGVSRHRVLSWDFYCAGVIMNYPRLHRLVPVAHQPDVRIRFCAANPLMGRYVDSMSRRGRGAVGVGF